MLLKQLCISALFFFCLNPVVYGEQLTYSVGVEALSYYPYFESQNFEYSGFARELLDLFATKNNLVFKYKPLPVKRLYATYLSKQTLDFKFPDHPIWSPDLKKGISITYSDPVVNYIDGVMVRPENLGNGEIELKRLGTVRGFTPWEYMSRVKDSTLQLYENSSFQGLLRQTIMGRVNGAYVNITVGRHQLETVLNQPRALVFDPGLPHTRSGYRISSIKHDKLIHDFNRFLFTHVNQINQLKIKYGLEEAVSGLPAQVEPGHQ